MGDARGQAGHRAAHRFFVDPGAVEGNRVRFEAGQWRQIRRVLRLSEGDVVVACDGRGREFRVSLGSAASGSGTIVAALPGRAEPRCRVLMYQSALRGDNFAWLLQKATEVGVSAVTPVLFSRTQAADYAARLDRYRTVVREAAEQCERSVLPIVGEPMALDAALRSIAAIEQGRGALLDEREPRISLRVAVEEWRRERASGPQATVSILVGPEGGLARGERSAAVDAGLLPVGLGPRILRSETAGLVAAAIVLAGAGDLD